MRKSLLYLFIVFSGLMISSCEQIILKDDPSIDPKTIFNHLWNDINNRYSYFEEKSINWDSLRIIYQEKVHEDMTDYNLFHLLSDMLFELRDGHVNLTSNFNRSRNWEWYRNFPSNYNESIVENNYLGNDHRITGPFRNQEIDSVLYINYRSFSSDISTSHLDQLMTWLEGMKGVIIDVRNNGGGSLENVNLLASCFTDHTYVFARKRTKTGPGRNDFSSWENMKVKPREGKKFPGKVVVLVNRKSYSATSFFAQAMKILPNVTLLGDQTGGGGGIPVSGELPNGWVYRFSASQTLTPEGDQIEFGVQVDVRQNLRFIDEQRGVDTLIEAALGLLRK